MFSKEREKMTRPEPTKREVIYPTFVCNAKCKFCYEKYSGRWGQEKSLDTIKQEILHAKNIGCDYIDYSGGEPTVYPYMTDVIKYATSLGMGSCIITNALCGEHKTKQIIDSGLDDWLISIHGLENSHEAMVGIKGARKLQERFLSQLLSEGKTFRFNCVINGANFNELPELALWMSKYNPRIVNFINFNPHNNWGNHEEEAKEFIADLHLVEPKLNSAISILESNNIGVNVRYYPMCRISEEYRRCICNDMHVHFDKYEWSYSVNPKSFETSYEWAKRTSNNIEEKGEPCNRCDLQNICGGINKILHSFTGRRMVDPVYNSGIADKNDFYYYRKNNVKTLI